MNLLNPTWFHKRSLTLVMVSLCFSLLAVMLGFTMNKVRPDPVKALEFFATTAVAAVLCVRSTINLIRDVGRGYSPARVSLAAALLLIAYAAAAWAALGIAGLFLAI